jgi:hypothetical protein
MHSGKWVAWVCKDEVENEVGGILGTEAEEGIALALGPVPHRNVAADEHRNQANYSGLPWLHLRKQRE